MDNHQSTSFSTNTTATTSAGTGENLGLGSSPDQAPVNAGTIVIDLVSEIEITGIEITHMNPRLYKAAANGDREFLRANPDQIFAEVTPNKNTVLHVAAQFGQADCVKEILKLDSHSSLLRAVNQKGETPLHIAAREGHLDVVVALIEESEALEVELESGVAAFKEIMRMTNDENDTPLHEAVRYDHLNVVKLLSSKDPEFTYLANNTGETPLYMAAQRGFHRLVLVILESCSSPAYKGPNGRTALHAAVIWKHKEMTKRILDWNPALTKEADEFGWTPLHCAAYMGYNPIVRHLLDKSDDSVIYLQIKNGNKQTALHLAASGGHLDVMKELISHSPDCCEQVDDRGWNVLHFTVMTGRLYFTQSVMEIHWLRVRGLVNKKNGAGNTPLHLLADYQILLASFITDSIVDKMAFNMKNMTALDILSSAKDAYVFKRFIQKTLKAAKACIGPLGWQHKFQMDQSDKKRVPRPPSELRDVGNTHLIVAALIATVAFAAGFTLPGGYNDNEGPDKGMALLMKKAAFKAFIVSDTIALALSIIALFIYFYMALFGRRSALLWDYLLRGVLLTNFAMLSMTVAFMTGIYAVLAPTSGLAVATCVIISCGVASFVYPLIDLLGLIFTYVATRFAF